MRSCLILILFCTPLLPSCMRGMKGSSKKAVKAEMDMVSDSLNIYWNTLITADDRKISDIGRLLLEISYVENYNEAEQERLQRLQKQLLIKRYDQESMTSEKIDAYDLATDSLINQVVKLCSFTPEIETHPLAEELTEEIKTEDSRLVIYRAYYDRWVKRYNQLLKAHSRKLKKLGPPYSSYKPKLLFELPAN